MASINRSKLQAGHAQITGKAGIKKVTKLIADVFDAHDTSITNVVSAQATDATNIAALQAADWDGIGKVSGSDFTRTAQTMGDITGLTFATLANSVYVIEVVCLEQSSTTAGNQWDCNHTGAGAKAQGNFESVNFSAQSDVAWPTLNTVTGTALTANSDVWHKINLLLTTGANAGTFSIRILKVTSGTATVYKGGIIRWKKTL